ncbi:MAG TPA: acetate--CoA ligase [Acidobacteriota bacterium]|jgi:acetyl-CoA synthetase
MSEKLTLESVLHEDRIYKPPAEFVRNAWVPDYQRLYDESVKDIEKFWEKVAHDLEWYKPWNRVLEWDYPFSKWFVGASCNIVHNALDRHINTWRRHKVAFLWEGENGDRRTITYHQLYCEVNRLANALKGMGVKRGDRVTIYLPVIPEIAISMLACAKIGAVHNVVFGGFSAEALRDRIDDAEAKVLITADGAYYRSGIVPLKENADKAVNLCPTIEHVIVVRRTGKGVPAGPKDINWEDALRDQSIECSTEHMDSNDLLYILYTSGSTGKPKGILHRHGGYMVGTYITTKWIFDLKETDLYWCPADPGWVTGHSYIVYGPLLNGATQFICEGAPDYPQPDRWWSIVERHRINVLYGTPTAIRLFMKYGEEWPRKHDLSSLRLLGTVGEPINPEAWIWYYKNIGRERCPIVDTWWQTETGQIMISPLPSYPLKPGSAAKPFPGIVADVVDRDGNSQPANVGGYLVIRKPWPAMLASIYKDPERYKQQYWSIVPGVYTTGDAAVRDSDGYIRVMGRMDDVLNVAGHRLGTMEIESALVHHPSVAEAAVIGKPHDVKGEVPKAFVTLRPGFEKSAALVEQLKEHVAEQIGKIARPEEIDFLDRLPKTRSGKIMRRLLKARERGESYGDTSTLEPGSISEEE